MVWLLAVLNALAALPKIVGYVEQFASVVTQWYVSRQTTETLSQIADAAAFAARANSQEERFQSAERWKVALSRPRYISK